MNENWEKNNWYNPKNKVKDEKKIPVPMFIVAGVCTLIITVLAFLLFSDSIKIPIFCEQESTSIVSQEDNNDSDLLI